MNTYAALAHKGKRKGETFAVHAETIYDAKLKAAEAAGLKDTYDVSVQLQVLADGTDTIGEIM